MVVETWYFKDILKIFSDINLKIHGYNITTLKLQIKGNDSLKFKLRYENTVFGNYEFISDKNSQNYFNNIV